MRYYARLAAQTPRILWSSFNHALAVAGVVALIAAVVNPVWAQAISGWSGFSPWWGLAAVIAIFLFGMAKANYTVYCEVDERVRHQQETEAALQQREQLVAVQQAKITQLQKAYAVSQAQYQVFQDWDRERGCG